jgi:hypothetical protein
MKVTEVTEHNGIEFEIVVQGYHVNRMCGTLSLDRPDVFVAEILLSAIILPPTSTLSPGYFENLVN